MNLSAFDLNLLKVLDALLRERSTVRAGERVGLSQPAVSAPLGGCAPPSVIHCWCVMASKCAPPNLHLVWSCR
ncbi:LysR family transcriptional regulator [Rhizobium sp. CBN3]|uniref:LysR family transcriptional regulator n=1 Tax=Rhizobium sp. CBN3 TaxID=3058045 RepID=UPI0034A0238A